MARGGAVARALVLAVLALAARGALGQLVVGPVTVLPSNSTPTDTIWNATRGTADAAAWDGVSTEPSPFYARVNAVLEYSILINGTYDVSTTMIGNITRLGGAQPDWETSCFDAADDTIVVALSAATNQAIVCKFTTSVTAADIAAGTLTPAVAVTVNGTDQTIPDVYLDTNPAVTVTVADATACTVAAVAGATSFTVTCPLTVTNGGDVTLTNVQVSNTSTAGATQTTYCSSAIASLAPGANNSAACTLSTTVTSVMPRPVVSVYGYGTAASAGTTGNAFPATRPASALTLSSVGLVTAAVVATPATPAAGTISLAITLTNNASTSLANVSLVSVTGGASAPSCTGDATNVASAGTLACTSTYTLTQAAFEAQTAPTFVFMASATGAANFTLTVPITLAAYMGPLVVGPVIVLPSNSTPTDTIWNATRGTADAAAWDGVSTEPSPFYARVNAVLEYSILINGTYDVSTTMIGNITRLGGAQPDWETSCFDAADDTIVVALSAATNQAIVCKFTTSVTAADIAAGTLTPAVAVTVNGTDQTIPDVYLDTNPAVTVTVADATACTVAAVAGATSFTVTCPLTVTNGGDVTLTNVQVSNTSTAGATQTTYCSSAIASLAPGANNSAACTLSTTVTSVMPRPVVSVYGYGTAASAGTTGNAFPATRPASALTLSSVGLVTAAVVATPATPAAGTISLAITLTNNASTSLANVSLVSVTGGASAPSCTGDATNVASAGTLACTSTYTLTQAAFEAQTAPTFVFMASATGAANFTLTVPITLAAYMGPLVVGPVIVLPSNSTPTDTIWNATRGTADAAAWDGVSTEPSPFYARVNAVLEYSILINGTYDVSTTMIGNITRLGGAQPDWETSCFDAADDTIVVALSAATNQAIVCKFTTSVTAADIAAGTLTPAVAVTVNGTDQTIPDVYLDTNPAVTVTVADATACTVAAVAGATSFTVTCPLTVTNGGDVTLTNVQVSNTSTAGATQTTYCSSAIASLAPGANNSAACTLSTTVTSVMPRPVVSVYGYGTAASAGTTGNAFPATRPASALTLSSVGLVTAAVVATPATPAAGTISLAITLTNNASTSLANVSLVSVTGGASAPSCTGDATNVASAGTLACTSTYTLTQAAFEAQTAPTFVFMASATGAANFTLTVPITLAALSADYTAALSGCALVPNTQAGAATYDVRCTATLTNTGNVRLANLAITGRTGCNSSAALAPGANVSCTVTDSLPWSTVNASAAVGYNVTIAATAALNTVNLTSFTPSTRSAFSTVTLTPTPAIALAGPLAPAYVNATGLLSAGLLNITNTGNLNLTMVSWQVTSDAPSSRLSALTVACSNLTQNGSLAAGAPAASCTQRLAFANVSDIEAGDVAWNVTATALDPATNTTVAARWETVVDVDNAPALALAVNASLCATPAQAINGARFSCPQGAVQLANTGNVRVDVADILVRVTQGAVVSVVEPTCSPNLTASNNATLLPGDVVQCSLSFLALQDAYEDGKVQLHAYAQGLSAYGTNTVIPNAVNATVWADSNSTIRSNAVLTATSAIDGAVGNTNDTIIYRVTVANGGNVILTNVTLTSNVVPAIGCNDTALADGLSPGERVNCTSAITFNATMIRSARNYTYRTNVTALPINASTLPIIAAAQTIAMPTCTDNRTMTPAAGRCYNLNSTQCRNANYECQRNTFVNRSQPLCTCYLGATTCDETIDWCVNTPCQNCRACVADWAPAIADATNGWAAETNAGLIASRFLAKCKALAAAALTNQYAVPYNASQCDAVANIIAAYTTVVNAPKRAGWLCRQLNQCGGGDVANCTIPTSTGVTAGNFSVCTQSGTTTGSAVVGAALSATNFTAGLCRPGTDLDCHFNKTGKTDLICGNNTASPIYTCDAATGEDVAQALNQCEQTPCALCVTCLKMMRTVVTPTVLAYTSAAEVAAAFNATCVRTRSVAECSFPTLAIMADPGGSGVAGNIGKRPAAFCRAMDMCSTDTLADATCVLPNRTASEASVATSALDFCSSDALAVSNTTKLPGVIGGSDVAPNGAADCTNNGTTADGSGDTCACSMAVPRTFCTCSDGVDTCTDYGKCITANCTTCEACVSATTAFTAQQANLTSAATVASNWATFCKFTLGKSDALCGEASAQILASPSGNIGKRAGALCMLVQSCAASLSCSAMTVNATIYQNTTVTGALSLCTVEGVGSGTTVPRVSDSSAVLPDNTCRFDNLDGTCQDGYQCNTTIAGPPTCVCDPVTGKDDCTANSACTPTPCKVCRDCLAEMAPFTRNQSYAVGAADLGAAFKAYCTRDGSKWPADACTSVANAIATGANGLNLGRRAAGLCKALGTCASASALGSNCTITINATLVSTAIDYCTVEGVSGTNATAVPGTSSGRTLPTKTCRQDNTDQCTTGVEFCDRNASVPFCTCADGADTCAPLGVCAKLPCAACNDCITTFTPFVSSLAALSVADYSNSAVIGAAFETNCTAVGGYSAASCKAARAAIEASVVGNIGKRVGALCSALGRCNSAILSASACTITGAGNFSLCTSNGGITGGSALASYPIATTLNATAVGGCRSDANCGAGRRCNLRSAFVSCYCAAATGMDVCETLGTCEDTPCTKCQRCLSAMQSYTNTSQASSLAAVQSGFTGACNTLTSPDTCTLVSNAFLPSGATGNFGKRAGAACNALGLCSPDVACQFNGTIRNVGALDLCTVDGVVGGAPAPAKANMTGLCLVDGDCGSDIKQCSFVNTTVVATCGLGGTDNTTTYGRCVAKPPTQANRPICDRCQACLTGVADTVAAAVNATTASAADLGAAFNAWCTTGNYTIAACGAVQAAVAKSRSGNLARRAGALCQRLGECDGCISMLSVGPSAATIAARAAADAANNVTAAVVNTTGNATAPAPLPVAGAVDLCTIEGVAGGALVDGTYAASGALPNGTCVLDSDCAAGKLCSGAAPVTVCRCFGGLDSCDALSTCVNATLLAPPPPPPVDTRTPCKRCSDCLAAAAPLVATTALSNNSFGLALQVVDFCVTNRSADPAACKGLGAQVAFSLNGNLAKRAGALCARLGECAPELAASGSTCNMTQGSLVGRLDMCTAEGLVSGGAIGGVDRVVLDNTTCVTNADCSNETTVCNLASGQRNCACANGVDACGLVGTCTNFCDLAATTTYISTANAKIVTCDPFDAASSATCGDGMTCQSSTSCRRLDCDRTAGAFKTVPCAGTCVPGSYKALAAKLSDNLRSIVVTLNTLAAPATFPCSKVITSSKLGTGAVCSVADDKLTAQLGPDATFVPGTDKLSFAATQTALVSLLAPANRFTATDLPVATCSSCAPVVVKIIGPASISDPCDDASASDVVFDASSSYDPSGRPLATFTWTQTGVDLALAAAIAAANAANGSPRLVIPGASLKSLAAGTNAVGAEATSAFGGTNDLLLSFTKVSLANALPDVTLPSVINGITYRAADGLNVPSALRVASVCPGRRVSYAWSLVDRATGANITDAWSALTAANTARKDLVIPGPLPPVVLPGGVAAADLRLVAAFDGAAGNTTIQVPLTMQASPLRAALAGPSGDVPVTRTVVLNASRSVDPDDPNGAAPFTFAWTCERSDFPVPCFTSGDAAGTQSGGAWSFSAAALTPNVEHTFKVAVSKQGDGRAASVASVKLTPRAAGTLSGRIVRVCAGAGANAPCPPRHRADSALTLRFVPDAGSETASVAWSNDYGGNPAGSAYIISAADLPKAGAVTVSANVTRTGSAQGTTQITVPINGAPYCAPAAGSGSTGCLALTARSTAFPNAAFAAEATGFVDDDASLRYDFGTVDAFGSRAILSSGPTPTYTFTSLPQGTTRVFVCAVDADGASACEDGSVTVTAAPADFKVTDALTAFDVASLAGAGDVAVLAAGAAKLQALSKFASSAGGADAAAASAAVAAKTGALLNTLASSASALGDDPAAVSQVVSAVSALSKTTKALSKDSLLKMRAVAGAGITAAKLSTKPLTPDAASRLLGVLASGASLPAACKLPTGCPAAGGAATTTTAARSLLQQEVPDWVSDVFAGKLLGAQRAAAMLAAAVEEKDTTAPAARPPAPAVQQQQAPRRAPAVLAPSMPAASRRRLLQDNSTAGNATAASSPSPSPAPAAAPSPYASPSYLADANAVAQLLVASPMTSSGFVSGGDAGLFVGVTALPGGSYLAGRVVVAAGPVVTANGARADESFGDNARASFSGALAGQCSDDNGAPLPGDACLVPVALAFLPDATSALDSAAPASDYEVVSGAVTLAAAAGGANLMAAGATPSTSGALPCGSSGCRATLTLPITTYAPTPAYVYQCARLVSGVPDFSSASVVSASGGLAVTNTSATPPVPTVDCVVTSPGTFVVGRTRNLDWPPAAGAPSYDNVTSLGLEVGKPLRVALEFALAAGYTFSAFIADAAKVESFKAAVLAELAGSLAIPASTITITGLREGSIIVDMSIDTSGMQTAQLQTVAGRLLYAPGTLFSPAFYSANNVTGVTATLLGDPPAPGPNVPAIVGGVVGGVGGALLVAGVALFIVRRRRMGGVEPRGNRQLIVDDLHQA